MPKRSNKKIFFDDGTDEDEEDPKPIQVNPIEEEEDDDDEEEANEDLSLKILEKALSRRDVVNKDEFNDSNELSMSDLCGSSNGKKSKSKKKMKKTKLEEKIVEDVVKGDEEAEPVNNMVLKKLLRGARYFDPPDEGWVSCYSCGEQGHITVNCPTPTTRRKPCFICGSLEHGAKQCTKGHDCYICKKSGHRAKECPDKYKSGNKSTLCLRCGDFGHEMILCQYDYSHDDLKDIQCYVCKSFGHLCCVEPGGDSPLWTVSCYRCGQLGHTALACGRQYGESNEEDSAIVSCFKCGEEGHFKRDCPNSSSLSYRGNGRESDSACFRCGEQGHFSRECPNASSIGGTSHGRDSPSLCYRCNGAGHLARECPNISKRNREASTPSRKSHKKARENSEYYPTTPHESNGKIKKKKKHHKGEEPQTTPQHRGGWITDDPEEEYFQRGSGHKHRHRDHNGRSHDRYSRSHRSSLSEPYHHHHHHHHHHHRQHDRYSPAPSRYGPTRHYDEF